MSCSLNSSKKGGYIGHYIGEYCRGYCTKGDTGSLDYSSRVSGAFVVLVPSETPKPEILSFPPRRVHLAAQRGLHINTFGLHGPFGF